MSRVNLHSLAGRVGVNIGRLVKTELIRKIQISEGNFDCYSTGRYRECDQANCLWRKDCFAFAALGEDFPERSS